MVPEWPFPHWGSNQFVIFLNYELTKWARDFFEEVESRGLGVGDFGGK